MSYIVPLRLCVILMITFLIQSGIERDISSDKNLDDYSMITVKHIANIYVQKHLKWDAWVIGIYQSFVFFLSCVFALSSFCNLAPTFRDITLLQFLLSNDKYFWIFFE